MGRNDYSHKNGRAAPSNCTNRCTLRLYFHFDIALYRSFDDGGDRIKPHRTDRSAVVKLSTVL